MRHSYSSDQRQQIDRYYKLSISLSEFRKLYNNVNVHIEEGFEEMNAIEFVNLLREEHQVMENIYGYLFGAQKSTMGKSTATDNQDFYNSQSSVVILEAAEKRRQKSMNKVKTFNMVKNAAWNCVLQDESDEV